MEVDVRHDLKRLRRTLNQVEKKALPQAVVRSLNRTATSTKAAAARNIASLLNSKQAEVKRAISIWKAHRSRFWAKLTASGRRKQLINFVVGSKALTQQKGGKRPPVRIKTFGKTRTLASGFITYTQAGDAEKSLYKRKSKKRYPLRMMYGPSVPILFKIESTQRAMRQKIAERFPIELRANLAYYVGRIRRR